MSWIKKYVPDLDVTPKEYCDAMTLSGTKVEGCTLLDADLDKIVVGLVKTCVPHPDSDHLHVWTVDVGTGKDLQIVCGAPNVAAGQKVPVVLEGGNVAGSHGSVPPNCSITIIQIKNKQVVSVKKDCVFYGEEVHDYYGAKK